MKSKIKYVKCPVCDLYISNLIRNYSGAWGKCPRCEKGWKQPEDFGWKKLGNFEQCNYWIVNLHVYPGSDEMWGWTASTWLRNGESLQIKKLNFKSNAGCKASFTLFAKKYGINYFEFE